VGAIRVPAISRRKDAPELLEAARLLEQSKCVLVFPEGTLRKCPEPVMRRFGRGIVKLLAEHPRTWVVPVWIEGAWGSYFSEAGGRPMTGKPMDFWRPIRIGIGEPRRIDPALLENHLKARAALQQAVYDCRGILGLDVPLAPAVFENQAEDPA
ncbi:MAG: 1-acyl-sn-glycerol-3-phosphate acyltransferase, partial [Planctomycetes bacterium]|nr:1-acyl-sn-glycerol-3-phosphate acyltransferase [Planctomycetota bacterium]